MLQQQVLALLLTSLLFVFSSFSNVHPFTGEDKEFKRGSKFFSRDKGAAKGVKLAREALDLSVEERFEKYLPAAASEDEEGEDGDMDSDEDFEEPEGK